MGPVDEVDVAELVGIMGLFRDFVDQRGVELDPKDVATRRPRTAFFTAGDGRAEYFAGIADFVWETSDNGVRVRRGGSQPPKGFRDSHRSSADDPHQPSPQRLRAQNSLA